MRSMDFNTKKWNITLGVGLFLILLSAIVLKFLDQQLFTTQFLFAVLISLGAGILAFLLTGRIRGSGLFGFINIESVSGGLAVFIIVFATYSYYSQKTIDINEATNQDVKKYFKLLEATEISFELYYIDSLSISTPLKENEAYKIIELISITNTKINIDFNVNENNNNYKKLRIIFDGRTIERFEPSLRPPNGWSANVVNNEWHYEHKFSSLKRKFSFNKNFTEK